MASTPYLHEVARRLVAFDTVSARSNVEAIEYLAGELQRLGFRTSVQRFQTEGVSKANLVASAGPSEPDGLMISGHVDTVPFEGQPGWTREPLRLDIDDDRVWGRGVSDMKVFLAQCLDAARSIDARRLARPIVFAFTADEEVGCRGAAQLAPALTKLLGDVPVPRLAWIGEPTSFEVFHAHKSVVGFRITVRGRGGHSGAPHFGVNAIAVAAKVIQTISDYQRELRSRPPGKLGDLFPDSPYTSFNFGTIHGGIAANVIAEECSLLLSYRALPDVDPLESYREIGRRIQTLDMGDHIDGPERARVVLGEPLVMPPFHSPRGTKIEDVLFEVVGKRPSRGALFTADGCQLTQAGITSLICGPGDLEQAHQPDESISRAAFERGSALVKGVIERFCGGA